MGVGKTTFTFSKSSITIDGGSTNINLTRDNQSYTNKLSHGYGDIYTFPAGVTDYVWSPTADELAKFFEEVPSLKTRTIDVYLDTYNGSTLVGRDTHALTVTLSSSTGKPTVSDFTISDSNTIADDLGIIVYGKSNLTASATPTAKYGATISRNVFVCSWSDGTHGYNYESYYIDDLIASLPLTTTPVSVTFGYRTTDSRGFTTTSALSKNVVAYQAPHIDTFEVIRCDADGNESDIGTKAKVIAKGSWAAMKVGTEYKNPATLTVGYEPKNTTKYTQQKIDITGGTFDISQILDATLDADTDYEFRYSIGDSFCSIVKNGIDFSNVKNILYVSPDGEKITIGTVAGSNVTIDSDSFDICNGSDTLATFTDSAIELGKNSNSSEISLCTNLLKLGLSKDTNYLAYMQTRTPGMVIGTVIPGSAGWTNSGPYIQITEESNISDNAIRLHADTMYLHLSDMEGRISDFVVAQGTSGNWTYRKWASGRCEIFGKSDTVTISNWGQYGAFRYMTLKSMALPFTITDARYWVGTEAKSGLYLASPISVDDYVHFYLISALNTDKFNGYLYYHVSGRWK